MLKRLTAIALASAALSTLPAYGQTAPAEEQVQAPSGAEGRPPAPTDRASEQLADPMAADVTIAGSILEPKQLPPTPEMLKQLKLPEGFTIDVFASNLLNPRMIAVAEDGTVYVTRRDVGDVVMLRDADGDGRAEVQQTVASRPQMHGIAIDGNIVYLATVNDVFRTERQADGTFGPLDRIIDDLPDAGQHPNRTLAMGPDGKLYISVGSTCNACDDPNSENATMLRSEPDGSSRTIFASGLRNTIGFGFHPENGELYGMDHGIDWLGDNEQEEELNHIQKGQDYGWPYIYAKSKFNPQDEPPGGLSLEEWAERSTEPLLLYTPHAAPMQMAFYEGGQFPDDYDGDAFVAMRGSWNRRPPSGYEVVRIDFEDGKPVGIEPFVTGFLMQTEDGKWGHLGRLAGLAVATDGALLLSDDENGVVYRISYSGSQTSAAAAPQDQPSPTDQDVATQQAAPGTPTAPQDDSEDLGKLAGQILGMSGNALDLSSPAFAEGEPIPAIYAAEGHDASPPLQWGKAPEGTQSYAVLMEDPDVKEEPPFVHWIVYNLPGDLNGLPEGLSPVPRLEEPGGALQGANDRGSIGYFGPRPPEGEPAHHYHIQVFALDTLLSLPHGANRKEVLDAISGHVLATGELTGTYQR